MAIHEMYPYLCVSDASAAIEFYSKVFGVRETLRLTEPGGRVGHAELDFNGRTLMLAEEFPEYGLRSATTIGATPVTIHLHVDDADELIGKAVEFGATVEIPPTDHSHGERSGRFVDPFGHRWLIGHSIEDVDPEEMQRRYTASPANR